MKTAVFDVGSELDQSGEKLLERLYAVIEEAEMQD